MADQDQIIDAVITCAIQADVARTHPLMAWVVMQDDDYPGQFVGRLVTDAPTSYILLADTSAGPCPWVFSAASLQK
jgi:hypothetical protein